MARSTSSSHSSYPRRLRSHNNIPKPFLAGYAGKSFRSPRTPPRRASHVWDVTVTSPSTTQRNERTTDIQKRIRQALNYLYSPYVEYDRLGAEHRLEILAVLIEAQSPALEKHELAEAEQLWIQLGDRYNEIEKLAAEPRVKEAIQRHEKVFPAPTLGSLKRMVWTASDVALFAWLREFSELTRVLCRIVVNAGLLDVIPAFAVQDPDRILTPAGKVLMDIFFRPMSRTANLGRDRLRLYYDPSKEDLKDLRIQPTYLAANWLWDYIYYCQGGTWPSDAPQKDKYPFSEEHPQGDKLSFPSGWSKEPLEQGAKRLHDDVQSHCFPELIKCGLLNEERTVMEYDDADLSDRALAYRANRLRNYQLRANQFGPGVRSTYSTMMRNALRRWVAIYDAFDTPLEGTFLSATEPLAMNFLRATDDGRRIQYAKTPAHKGGEWSMGTYDLFNELPKAMQVEVLKVEPLHTIPSDIDALSERWRYLYEGGFDGLSSSDDEDKDEEPVALGLRGGAAAPEEDDSLEYEGSEDFDDNDVVEGPSGTFNANVNANATAVEPVHRSGDDCAVESVSQPNINPEKLKTREQKFGERVAPTGEVWYRDHVPYFPFAEHPTIQNYWWKKPEIDKKIDSLMKWDQSYLGKKSATISEYFSAKKSTPENEADPALDGVDLEEAEGDTELDELLGKLSPDEDIDKEIEDFLANEPEERRKAREELTVRMLVEDRMQNEIMRDLHVNTFPLPPEPSRAAAEKTAFFVDLETVFDDLPDYPYAKLRPLIPPEDQLVEWADDFDPGSDDEKGESDVETEKPARKEPSKEGPSRRAPSKSAPSRGEKPSRKEEPLRRPKVSRKSSLGRCMKTQQPVKKPILRSAMKRKADDAAGNDEKRVNFG